VIPNSSVNSWTSWDEDDHVFDIFTHVRNFFCIITGKSLSDIVSLETIELSRSNTSDKQCCSHLSNQKLIVLSSPIFQLLFSWICNIIFLKPDHIWRIRFILTLIC
jgi:hypothetical protein